MKATTGNIKDLTPDNRNANRQWAQIEGYGGDYLVSNLGEVLGVERTKTGKDGRIMKVPQSLLKQAPDRKGYMQVSLTKNAIGRTFKVHRLVASAFVLNPNGSPHVNHKNGVKNDNRAENLEWVTPQQNSTHAVESGLMANHFGEKSHAAKLTNKDMFQIKTMRSDGMTQIAIAKEFGVSQSLVCRVMNGQRRAIK